MNVSKYLKLTQKKFIGYLQQEKSSSSETSTFTKRLEVNAHSMRWVYLEIPYRPCACTLLVQSISKPIRTTDKGLCIFIG